MLSRVSACKEKILSMVKQESVMKEKLDENEEDDANIPEEDHEVELELQKPQLRVINKIPS